jgi:hypothetical protein
MQCAVPIKLLPAQWGRVDGPESVGDEPVLYVADSVCRPLCNASPLRLHVACPAGISVMNRFAPLRRRGQLAYSKSHVETRELST